MKTLTQNQLFTISGGIIATKNVDPNTGIETITDCFGVKIKLPNGKIIDVTEQYLPELPGTL